MFSPYVWTSLGGTKYTNIWIIRNIKKENPIPLNDTYWYSNQEQKNQTFERNKSLWCFTKYSSQNMPFLKKLHLNDGKWTVKGYTLWNFNGLFLTHLCISRFYFIYFQTIDQLSNWIDHEAACVRRHIQYHMRDCNECRYITRGLWCVMSSAVIATHKFNLTTRKVEVKCWYPWKIGRKFNVIFCCCFLRK